MLQSLRLLICGGAHHARLPFFRQKSRGPLALVPPIGEGRAQNLVAHPSRGHSDVSGEPLQVRARHELEHIWVEIIEVPLHSPFLSDTTGSFSDNDLFASDGLIF